MLCYGQNQNCQTNSNTTRRAGERKLKYEWLQASGYMMAEGLFYRVRQALAAVGKGMKIQFSEFSTGSS